MSDITIKKADFNALFSALPDTNEEGIEALLHPEDKQNVPYATKCLLKF